ncbi:MAG: ABC transporter ATP-binding protein [Eubacteriales bacterium]|nr:ABC transporter ATP-binding protein [Eubacteriales bacterium]
MLKFENVTFTYKESHEPIFKEMSLRAERGSFVSIIGASGSGKTTIFRLLNGLEQPDAGMITVDGTPISELSHYASYMPQQDLLFPWLTVEKNVMLPMTVQKLPKAECKKKALEMLERVGLSEWAGHYPKELSGGMRQRASFARTLCAGSDLLLLDEPFSALDSITRISLQEWLLKQWSELNKTVLFITHDVEEAIFLSQRILVLTGHPVTGLREFTVPLPKARNRDMLLQPDIAQLKEELIALLRSEAKE